MDIEQDSIVDSNDDVQSNHSVPYDQNDDQTKDSDGELVAGSMVREEDRLSWGRNKGLIVACAVLVSLPAAIPIYFGTKVEQTSAQILFFLIGLSIILFNLWVVAYVIRRARRPGN